MTLNKPLTLTALILSVPALAFAGITTGDTLGVNEEDIRAQLEAQGYEVLEVEIEEDEIEVEVLKDGIESEFVLSAADGIVQEIETEDGDDDDDDDDDGEDKNGDDEEDKDN